MSSVMSAPDNTDLREMVPPALASLIAEHWVWTARRPFEGRWRSASDACGEAVDV